jgi:DNA-binding winged helix-turn-helix (wHTH) protein
MPKARSNPETYCLDLVRYELRRSDGGRIKLERQAMDLLIALVERKGQLVTRDEIASRLWPASISVESEPAINNAIRKIRAALHDSPEQPTYLETVVGKGYRFIGEIETIHSEPQPIPVPEMPGEPRARTEPAG